MESVKSFLSILWIAVALTANAQYNDQVLNAFRESYVFEKNGDYKKAAALLKNNYQEDSYEFNLRIGWLLYNAGAFEESANYYRKALMILPYSEEARFGLTLPLLAQNNTGEAVKIYKEILENSPGNTVALYRLGMVYFNGKDWSQALTCFQKVVDLYPFGYDGLLMLGKTSFQLGKKREALILFNKVLLYNPGDPAALEALRLLR